jgi:hypothetical protein
MASFGQNRRVKGGKREAAFSNPKMVTIGCLSENVLCGSRVPITPGFIALSTICISTHLSVHFKDWDSMGYLFKMKRDFSFQQFSSFFLPSIHMDESLWCAFIRTCQPFITAGLHHLYSVALSFEEYLEWDDFVACVSINNLELNRFVLAQCGSTPSCDDFVKLHDDTIWSSIMQCPSFGIRRICAFCFGLDRKISNMIAPIDGYLTTANDLSAPPNGQVPIPDRPHVYTHPTESYLTIWNLKGMGSPGQPATGHIQTYEERIMMLIQLEHHLTISSRERWVLWCHYTEGENADGVSGWHSHVNAASMGLCQVRIRRDIISMPWACYILMCNAFKWLMKVNQAWHGQKVSMTKFTELPFPVPNTLRQLRSYGNTRVGIQCIMIQLLCLRSNAVPVDLLVPKSKCRINGRFSAPTFKTLLWQAMWDFIMKWDPPAWLETESAAIPFFHRNWTTIGEAPASLEGMWKQCGDAPEGVFRILK